MILSDEQRTQIELQKMCDDLKVLIGEIREIQARPVKYHDRLAMAEWKLSVHQATGGERDEAWYDQMAEWFRVPKRPAF